MAALGDGPPLPGVTTPRSAYTNIGYEAVLLEYMYIRAMLFGWNIYSRCYSAEIYTGDDVLLEYVIMGDAVLLKCIRPMLGVLLDFESCHDNYAFFKPLVLLTKV